MIIRPHISLLLLLAWAGGCFGGSSSTSYSASDILEQMPEGRMQGEDWTMVEAVVRVDSFDPDRLSVGLYPVGVDDCAVGVSAEGGEILFSVPRTEGEYPLALDFTADSQTITFAPAPGENLVSTEGVIVVEGLTDSSVTLGVVAEADDSDVNGRFTAAICP